jgi:hypothetical protein
MILWSGFEIQDWTEVRSPKNFGTRLCRGPVQFFETGPWLQLIATRSDGDATMDFRIPGGLEPMSNPPRCYS